MSRTIIVSAVIFVAAIGVQGSDIGHSLTTLTSAIAFCSIAYFYRADLSGVEV